ncbi:serine/threonine-protein kinase [Biformimicrobium ophioploci]|uniref:Protein kinase domain-containing protein n=1 Tax=Biformimicrobium ophioploci TaxID=3036711 RepID=A0ABQ6LY63_9GAMM|nr:serine/threonine-protein kinase [Microbulbifer sp. NKW57]GMG87041.1 hypothetical protein MNKW57_13620 [Microbulbifer sp. NKW57]
MPETPVPPIGDRYRTLEELGSGGMGRVFAALDERLGRKVAIKQLDPEHSEPVSLQRIRREAVMLAQLNHPAITQIYDVLETDTGCALVMEFVEGETLTEWQTYRHPTLSQKLSLLVQIASGLTRAHANGIIHRDLKPDNVLVKRNGAVKIVDFGIARSFNEESGLTQDRVPGSYYAMSPEQALGAELDPRCDLFAFGMLAYGLLCGQGPFGNNPNPIVIVDRIIHARHPAAGSVIKGLPRGLSKLLDQLLEKDPEKRPLSAALVAEELAAIQQQAREALETELTETASATTEAFFGEQSFPGARQSMINHTTLFVIALSCAVMLFAALWLPNWLERTGVQSGKMALGLPPVRVSGSLPPAERAAVAEVAEEHLHKAVGRNSGITVQAPPRAAPLTLYSRLDCTRERCIATLDLVERASGKVLTSRSDTLLVPKPHDNIEPLARIVDQLLGDIGSGEQYADS